MRIFEYAICFFETQAEREATKVLKATPTLSGDWLPNKTLVGENPRFIQSKFNSISAVGQIYPVLQGPV